ncbi:uncharacterized protein THITE_2096971 [Thermothielavioides terrestris NRRL 8126]|uniref:tetrahydrofolate synthase n=1 Tax=Thermothielavioides terrestris (strain ATCC 38088 / NRRL 8126) TaxID=578455 RepID=G2RDF9_THETT|nr:uncharacterized protein THITE_2096971 [Thermothielavioides terrestris NRRL 8126]AEO69941.1 hypothetical protein THITE_2096971 [Thermothielavioides terrestris NRRL 8126]
MRPLPCRITTQLSPRNPAALLKPTAAFLTSRSHSPIRNFGSHHYNRPKMASTDDDQAAADYAAALARLAQLQSNRAVTSLFDKAPAPPAGTGTGSGTGTGTGSDTDKPAAPAAADLNALAIPEMLAWLRRAGYSGSSLADAGVRCVHVAGTKGKGSVSALIAAILAQYGTARTGAGTGAGAGTEAGDVQARGVSVGPVGLYTSPHVLSPRERIVLDGEPLAPARFARYVEELWARFTRAARDEAAAAAARRGGPLGAGSSNGDDAGGGGGEAAGGLGSLSEAELAELDGPATKPFYFRFLTILALHVFLAEGARSAVVECGIGGEYDATSALLLPPSDGGDGAVSAAVVTQLGLDHVGMLGDTVEKIAWHKSGVFKPGVKAFTRRLPAAQAGVMEVLRARAREKGATLVEVRDEDVEAWGGVEGARLQGPFQKHNMALAVHAAREHLLRIGVRFEGRFGTDEWSLSDIPPEFVRGLKEASLRGRCEVFEDADGVMWHLDGAHTDDSLAGVGRWFAGRTRGDSVRVLLFNQQERDPGPLLGALFAGAQAQQDTDGQPVFTHAIFTRNEEQKPADGEERDLSAQTKAAAAVRDLGTTTQVTVRDAVQTAVNEVRAIAAQARKDGKSCQVLVTGSFHLVGPVLKTISNVEC